MARKPKEERTFDGPVAWLVGRDLLGGIKGIILYTAYGSKLDPRDWMTGQVFDFRQAAGNKEEFWFDYIADAGDGTKAMYAIAYMALSDLRHDGRNGVTFDHDSSSGSGRLPRGEFLFFGGDTSYHVADYLTLANRIQRPFTYAFEDLLPRKIEQRPVFGIPGNHDYYDQVDGFRRQFRKPVRPEPPQPPESPGDEYDKFAQLGLAGFDRVQEASYTAIKLPFDWCLWGLDTETGPLDKRQKEFFAALTDTNDKGEAIPPKKLIIATSSPSTVFGKVANEEDDFKATKALKSLLGEGQPFLPIKHSDGTFDFSVTGDARISPGHCRLDLSGDVHHYARYWGPPPVDANPAREHSKSPAPSAESYASVVSGLGGAFHHPSFTYDDELQEQVLYPTEETSREAVGKKTFNFVSIWKGGYVWLFGAIIALAISFGLSIAPSSRQFFSQFFNSITFLKKLDLMPPELVQPTTSQAESSDPCQPVKRLALWRLIAHNPTWQPPSKQCKAAQPFYFSSSQDPWPKDLVIGQILIFASLGLALVIIFLGRWFFGPKDDYLQKKWDDPKPNWKIALLVVPTTVAVFLGVLSVEPYHNHITPYASSLIVLFTMVVAASAIILTVRYNDYLFTKGHFKYVRPWDRFWPWVLPILSVLVVAASLWSFGRNNLPAWLVTDILCTLVFVGVFVVLVVLPLPLTSINGELFYTVRPKILAFMGRALIGLWHAILQLLVPFFFIRRGNFVTWAVAALFLVLPIPISAKLFKNNRRVALMVLWFLYGGLILLLPWLTSKPVDPLHFDISLVPLPPFFQSFPWFSGILWGLVPSLFAAGVGAVMSCLWFGWYLGICAIFNGHNNEIGGAAMIENFKEFIRFRLTPDGLTGFVIAVDDVSIIGEPKDPKQPEIVNDGSDLTLKLIDVFHLKVKRSEPPQGD